MDLVQRIFRSLILSIITSALISVPALSLQQLPESEINVSRGYFIENVGQFAGSGRFVLPGSQGYTWVEADGIWVTRLVTEPVPTLRGKHPGHIQYVGGNNLHIRFANANLDAKLIPFGQVDTHVSYLKGADRAKWHTDVPVWGGVRYVDIYPGIDLLLETDTSGEFHWELDARSGAILENVKMVIEGADQVVYSGGMLKISTNLGDYGLLLPTLALSDTYEILNPLVPQSVTELTDDIFQINTPFVSSQATLSMEPSLLAGEDLIFSTYLGRAGTDSVNGVDVNSLQEVFVTGNTLSTDFPTNPGAFDPDLNAEDGFVIRLNKDGTGITYATHIGGSSIDEANGIGLDGDTAFIVGSTYSDDFPLAGPKYSDTYDAFVAALNATGTDLVYAKLHGGEEDDYGYGIDVESDLAYITGTTWSKYIPGASAPAKMRGFAAKFDSSGNRLFGVVFGGRGLDAAYAIKVSGGNSYITGESDSYDLGPGGSNVIGVDDAYVIKVSSTGEKVFARMLGGNSFDRGNCITVDSSGRAIIAGTTDPLEFPVSEGSVQGGYDGFLAVLNSAGTAWDYVTLIGGEGSDSISSVSLDFNNGIQVFGNSNSAFFPTTTDAYQPDLSGEQDTFVTRFDLSSSHPGHVTYSTYLGGSEPDLGKSIAIDPWGYTYLGGITESTDFPVSFGSFDTSLSGAKDGFVAKLTIGPIPGIYLETTTDGSDANAPPGPYILVGEQVNWTYWVSNTGPLVLSDVTVNDNRGVPITCPKNTLGPAESMTCTSTGTAIAGQYSNIGSVSANPPGALPAVTDSDPSHYYGAQPLLVLEKYVSGDNGEHWVDADLQPGPYFLAASSLKYKLVLDNTGNVPVENPLWSDPGLDLTACPLPDPFTPEAPPVECILAGSWDAGQHGTIASASSTYTDTAGHVVSPLDSDAAYYFGAQPGVSIIKSTNGEDANIAPGPGILVGDSVGWTYLITNTGNVPIADIAVVDDNGTPLISTDDFPAACGSTLLGPGNEQTCSASRVAVIGPYSNTAEVSAQPKIGSTPIGPAITDSDVSHYFGVNISYTLEKTTNGEVLDNNAPGPFVEIGSPVTWIYTVTNASNVTLTNIQVYDDNGTTSNTSDDYLVCSLTSIAPGQTSDPDLCKSTKPALPGQYTNLGWAELTTVGKDFSESDYGHYYGYDPDIWLDMTATLNSQSGGSPPGVYLFAGDDIHLRYTVYNSSPSEMTINELTDDNGTPGDSSDDVTFCLNVFLAPFSTHVCPRPINQALVGQHTHTGHVTTTVASTQLTHDVASSYFGVQGGITLDVHTNGQDPAAALELLINVGDPLVWEYFIENTSNIPLSQIHLIDPTGTTIPCPAEDLVIGEKMTCTKNGNAQPGVFQNDAHVKGVWPDDLQAFYADAVSTYFGVQGGVLLEFKANGLPADESPGQAWFIGDAVELTYELTNTGNYPMIGITVTDNANNLISCPATTLEVGASFTCTAQEYVAAGLQSRVATIHSTVNGKLLSATDPIYYTGVERPFQIFLPFIRR